MNYMMLMANMDIFKGMVIVISDFLVWVIFYNNLNLFYLIYFIFLGGLF